MSRILDFNDGFYIADYDFGQAQVAASQSAVALPIHASRATNGASLVTNHVMPYDGSIIGIDVEVSAASSAGTGSVSATLDGTAVTATQTAITAVTEALAKFDGQNTGRFVAGANLGIKITTDGTWNATTSDIHVRVRVLHEGVHP